MPAAVVLHRGLVLFAIQGDGDGLARFCVGATGQHQILLRLGGVNDVVVGKIVYRDGRWQGIYRHHARGVRAVAVAVGHADINRRATVG